MIRISKRIAAVVVIAVTVACTTQAVQNKEDTVVPANTLQRQASLATLPPHKFVRQIRSNKVLYTYADPTICGCLYVGDQAAYGRYRENVFLRRLANEQQMTAEMNQMNWDAWGPGWYY